MIKMLGSWVTEKELLNRAVSAVNTVSQGVVLFACEK